MQNEVCVCVQSNTTMEALGEYSKWILLGFVVLFGIESSFIAHSFNATIGQKHSWAQSSSKANQCKPEKVVHSVNYRQTSLFWLVLHKTLFGANLHMPTRIW